MLSTGLGPDELGRLDESFLIELADADVDRRWGNVEELLAQVAELIDKQTRVLIRLFSDGKRPPEPIRIRRPGDKGPPTLSMGDMARRMSRR